MELKRAAVERRERAVAEREETFAERGSAKRAEEDQSPSPLLVFLPGAAYSLVELEHPPVRAGATLALDTGEYVVARTGPSPLPGDARRCAYLVRGPARRAALGRQLVDRKLRAQWRHRADRGEPALGM